MGKFELLSFQDAEELARATAARWLKEIGAGNGTGVSYAVALAGGRIALQFFSAVAELAGAQGASLQRVHFFWGDERCVSPDDPESNFRLARELLLEPLRIPGERIHRIRGEVLPEMAAAEAAAELCRLAPCGAGGQPVLDLVFLGLGEDGHVASLFPGEPETVIAGGAVYRTVTGTKPPPQRVTLGYPAIAAARQVWVLVSGAGKAGALRESLRPAGRTPLARVLRMRPETRIFTDVFLGPAPL
jgi:6-phosphogluconolactonase